MFVLIYQSPDNDEVPSKPDAVSDDLDRLKAYAVNQNGGEDLKWIEGGCKQSQLVAYVEVGDEDFDENGETECFYVIDEVDFI